MKRRRVRERDEADARERADRRRDELLARLRGGPVAPPEGAEPAEAEEVDEVEPATAPEPEVPAETPADDSDD